MDSLPREIMLNILSRLPITSLLQIKFVCRAWRNLVQDPHLAHMHFSQVAKNDPGLILHSDCPIRNQLFYSDVTSNISSNEILKKVTVSTMPEFDIAGSCNGLLCLCDSSGNNAYVYNPFSRTCIELPKSTQYLNQEAVFGFGFHPMTKEYKMVKILSCTDVDAVLSESEVQVLTLSSLTWRSLGQISYHLIGTPTRVLLNGRLHWLSWGRRHYRVPVILSFDLADERFEVVPKPNCCGSNRCGYQLVILGDCLSATAFCNQGKFEIWVMKEYGVVESWVKEYSIGTYLPRGLEQDIDESFKVSKFYLNSGFVRVLCLLKNGEILLEYECRALVSYDPKHGTFKDLIYHGMPGLFEAVLHVGNLCWIESVLET